MWRGETFWNYTFSPILAPRIIIIIIISSVGYPRQNSRLLISSPFTTSAPNGLLSLSLAMLGGNEIPSSSPTHRFQLSFFLLFPAALSLSFLFSPCVERFFSDSLSHPSWRFVFLPRTRISYTSSQLVYGNSIHFPCHRQAVFPLPSPPSVQETGWWNSTILCRAVPSHGKVSSTSLFPPVCGEK